MKKLNVLSLFDGMSCGMIALDNLGIDCNYYASEIDKYAIKVSQDNYPNIIRVGDVTKLSYKDGVLTGEFGSYNVGTIDLLIGGSPCQSLSRAGDGTGLEGKSSLFYHWLRLKNEINPMHFLLENVKMKKEYENIITENLSCSPVRINSSSFSAQLRDRLYWTNLSVLEYEDSNIVINDILASPFIIQEKKNTTLQINPSKKAGGTQPYYQDRVFHISGKTHCLCVFGNGVWVGDNCSTTWFKLTPEHHEMLQTVPVGYTKCVSNSQRYKMLGNGWTVKVIEHILKGLK